MAAERKHPDLTEVPGAIVPATTYELLTVARRLQRATGGEICVAILGDGAPAPVQALWHVGPTGCFSHVAAISPSSRPRRVCRFSQRLARSPDQRSFSSLIA